MAYNVNKKIAKSCQGGICRILIVDTLCYHFKQKIAYIPNLMVIPNPKSNLLDLWWSHRHSRTFVVTTPNYNDKLMSLCFIVVCCDRGSLRHRQWRQYIRKKTR